MTPASQNDARIFIVDDERANLRLVSEVLRQQGYYRAVPIMDPRDVIDQYRLERPALILLDINMPYLNGYQVIEQLQALNDPLLPPIVVLTAQHGKEHLLQALAAGARDFVTKPFDRSELLMRVRNLLDAYLAQRMIHDQKTVLEEMVRKRTDELQRTRLQVVQRLGMAAEYRDEHTGSHILQMSHICALLARAVGWSEAACELMLNASPMHDVGKIGIPDAVLLKPGKLEPDEWELMKTHALIGGRLLAGDDSDLLRMARDIALAHHERWDGSGYPFGLAGEDIPQAGRIAAVADVFDALISTRPYKAAWPLEVAADAIKQGSGRQFDPGLVEVFLQEFPRVLELRQRFVEPGQVA